MLDQISFSLLGFLLGVSLTALYYLHTVNIRLGRLEKKTEPLDDLDQT